MHSKPSSKNQVSFQVVFRGLTQQPQPANTALSPSYKRSTDLSENLSEVFGWRTMRFLTVTVEVLMSPPESRVGLCLWRSQAAAACDRTHLWFSFFFFFFKTKFFLYHENVKVLIWYWTSRLSCVTLHRMWNSTMLWWGVLQGSGSWRGRGHAGMGWGCVHLEWRARFWAALCRQAGWHQAASGNKKTNVC